MIDLYTWATPNGRKISIALEELGLSYDVHPINIFEGDQFTPGFTAVSPNQKIPAIVDHEMDINLMESGAILMYLADKTGRLLPRGTKPYWETIQWLMWQKGGLGPMLGQAHHYLEFNRGKAPYSEDRYLKEAQRLYSVLNRQLAGRQYLAAGEYTIADIASWPWVARFEFQRIDLGDYPNVRDWYLRIAERPAVKAGFMIPVQERLPMPA
ncbi:MAG: glutathione S-transferase N-terminal domain-containing protein [Xanthomonadales bacterium]|nr:glutathione S-transferase N-terminal domain-containing protein [Xanthomonadales bacterium]